MVGIRIYQLAKELNRTSKEIIDILKEINIFVSSHMSTLSEEQEQKARNFIDKKSKELEKPEKEKIKEKLEKKPPKKIVIEKKKKEEKVEEVKIEEEKITPPEQEIEIEKEIEKEQEKEKITVSEKIEILAQPPLPQKTKLQIPEIIGIRELAAKINISTAQLLKDMIMLGIVANINQSISLDVVNKVIEKYGFYAEKEIEEDIELEEKIPEDGNIRRPPIVTIMGHVDHGKTKLLDAFRSSNIAEKEVGGITQHIGAYIVEFNGEKIVFLDTPGHEAFTSMRARGAKITDIVVLVVAADDGVMPQTIEAIHHAQAAQVPIIAAINKIDKPEANVDRVKRQLLEAGLVAEEWGGDTVVVQISAKFKIGINELLEMILLVAEMLELKANPYIPARGTVIDAKLDKRKGAVATLLVEHGTLTLNKIIVVGSCYGKIKAMFDDRGRKVISATPSTPVEILGLNGVPFAGEKFIEVKDEKTARQLAEKMTEKMKIAKQGISRITLTSLYQHIKEGKVKELNIILKADVQGSLEAIKQSLERLDYKEVVIKIIHSGVGGVTESDVMLAVASNALIIGFNVRPTPQAQKLSEIEKVDIRTYNIIYYLIEDIKAAMQGMLEPKYEEELTGRGEIREIFRIPKIGIVAGCYVQEGTFLRSAKARVIRDNIIIYEGEISSLKRFKDDVKEVPSGYECGLMLKDFQDIKKNDTIEIFQFKEIKPELK